MKSGGRPTKAVTVTPVGTWDSASRVDSMKAIDLTMRQYFGVGMTG